MNANGARLLREERQRGFDLALHGHHEIGQLVDHDHDVRQHAAPVRALFERDVGPQRRQQRRAFTQAVVELLHVPAPVGGEQFVASLHLSINAHFNTDAASRLSVITLWRRCGSAL